MTEFIDIPLEVHLIHGDIETLVNLYQLSRDNQDYLNSPNNIRLLAKTLNMPNNNFQSFIDLVKGYDRRHLGYSCYFSRKLEDCLIEIITSGIDQNRNIRNKYFQQLIIETPIEELIKKLEYVKSNIKDHATWTMINALINSISKIISMKDIYGDYGSGAVIHPSIFNVVVLRKYPIAFVNALYNNYRYDPDPVSSVSVFKRLTQYIGNDVFLQLVANIISGRVIFEINVEEAIQQYNIEDLYQKLLELVDDLNLSRYQLNRYLTPQGFTVPQPQKIQIPEGIRSQREARGRPK